MLIINLSDVSLPTFDANNPIQVSVYFRSSEFEDFRLYVYMFAYQCNYKHIVETNTTPT
jgi:hypothetical protein